MKYQNNFANVGFQLNVHETYALLADYIEEHGVPVIQFFLFCPKRKTYISLNAKDSEAFSRLRPKVQVIVIHTSYWINLSSGKHETRITSAQLLEKELKMAVQLKADYLVLHPGSAKTQPYSGVHKKRAHAIKQCAAALNELAPRFPQITILLENTALGKTMVGSDLEDLKKIYALVGDHKNIGFCLDIAHAHMYGYDVCAVDDFLKEVDKTIGLDKVKLIHLNDTEEVRGSGKDVHAVPGEGVLGASVLRQFIHHPLVQHLPFVMEFPAKNRLDVQSFLKSMQQW